MKTIVENLVNDKGNRTANQFIIRNDEGLFFKSYESMICKVGKNGRVILGRDWDYSNTTRKYLYTFLRDYTRFQVRSRKELLKLLSDKAIEVDENL